MSGGEWVTRNGLARLGWTGAMVRALLGPCDQVGPWRSNRWPEHRYARARVDAAMQTEVFAAMAARRRERAERRRTAPERQAAEFAGRYGHWRAALGDACRAMYALNRHAKHPRCEMRHEIYELKDRLMRLLYEQGLCVEAWPHVQTLPAKLCWDCGGTGDDGLCCKCYGSGEYLPEKQVRYVCFRFVVGGQPFVWHRPAPVGFPVTMTGPEQGWDARPERAVGLPGAWRLASMRLVRWVVETAAAEAEAAAA